MKSKIFLTTFVLIGAALPLTSLAASPAVISIKPSYIVDPTDDSELVGAAHNVFAAKILNVTSKELVNGFPQTIYRAQVVHNIKGVLKGEVTLVLAGGDMGGAKFVIDRKDPDAYFLKPGFTYLLVTRYSPEDKRHYVNPYEGAIRLLASNPRFTVKDLGNIAASDWRTKQLVNAYKNEKPLPYDVKHGRAFNSYKSVAPER